MSPPRPPGLCGSTSIGWGLSALAGVFPGTDLSYLKDSPPLNQFVRRWRIRSFHFYRHAPRLVSDSAETFPISQKHPKYAEGLVKARVRRVVRKPSSRRLIFDCLEVAARTRVRHGGRSLPSTVVGHSKVVTTPSNHSEYVVLFVVAEFFWEQEFLGYAPTGERVPTLCDEWAGMDAFSTQSCTKAIHQEQELQPNLPERDRNRI